MIICLSTFAPREAATTMNSYWHATRSSCETFGSYRVPANRYIQSTCATTGEGLYEGLDWLSSNIASKVYIDKWCDCLSVTIVLLCDQSGDNSYIWPFCLKFQFWLLYWPNSFSFLICRLEALLWISTANWLGAPDVSWKLGTESPLQPVRCLLPAWYIFCLEYVMMSLSNVCSTLLYCWMFFGLVHFAQGLEFQYHDTLGTYYILHSYTWLVVAKELPYHVTCECRSGFLWDLVQQSKLFHPEVKVCS